MKGRSGGSYYLRKSGKSRFYVLDWYDAQGRRHRESSGTDDERRAKGMLAVKLAAVEKGEPTPVNQNKVTVAALLADVRADYVLNGKRLEAIEGAIGRPASPDRPALPGRLIEAFGRMRACDVTTAMIRAYQVQHQRTEANPDGLANGTLNRDLAVLRRAYTLASKGTPPKVVARPDFPMLAEAPPRSGWFEEADFAAVLRHLPAEYHGIATFAKITGWRRSEIIGHRRPEGTVNVGASGFRRRDGAAQSGHHEEQRRAGLPVDRRATRVPDRRARAGGHAAAPTRPRDPARVRPGHREAGAGLPRGVGDRVRRGGRAGAAAA